MSIFNDPGQMSIWQSNLGKLNREEQEIDSMVKVFSLEEGSFFQTGKAYEYQPTSEGPYKGLLVKLYDESLSSQTMCFNFVTLETILISKDCKVAPVDKNNIGDKIREIL